MNTEIGKTGEVTVEGHVIGRLDGFMFAPESAEAGSDAKALQATALKALAGEIDARAEKLANAADDQFALASDGTLRWTGDAVAKLVAADDTLNPRIRIVADERLTGASRDSVQTRLDLWLKTHIEKILAPLFELQKAEDVTGIARGIAFQIIESLGVLERAKIAAEMKDLDQPSRASLRKYGVRFGAYHIYTPALLKPAARGLASLLWALKQDNVDWAALTSAQHLAASGRTSFAADKAMNAEAYRTLGYKLAGERAVRVDILERLADLIRPALSWRPASPGPKPPGTFDGRSFTVTQAMTSLTGSAGEDFASVLRALGYRMDRRPPMPVVETAVGETIAPDTAATEAVAAEPGVAIATDGVADITNETAVPAASLLPEVAFAPAVEVSDAVSETASAEDSGIVSPEPATTETAAPATADAAAAAAPELVEVWRPGGRSDERRPRHDRNRHRNGRAPDAVATPDGEAGAEIKKREHPGRNRRPRNDAPPTVSAEGGEAAQARGPREDRGSRPPREPFKGRDRDDARGPKKFGDKFKGKFDKGGRDKGSRDGRKDDRGGGNLRTYATSAAPGGRDRPADPNSPFAKLAALKEQLAGRKD